jgi:hypothetical protein
MRSVDDQGGPESDPVATLHRDLDQALREEGRTSQILLPLVGVFCLACAIFAVATTSGLGLALLGVAMLGLPGITFIALGILIRRRYVAHPLRDATLAVDPRAVGGGERITAAIGLDPGANPVKVGIRCEEWSSRSIADGDGGVHEALDVKIRHEEWHTVETSGTVSFEVPVAGPSSTANRRWVAIACRSRRPLARRTEVAFRLRAG